MIGLQLLPRARNAMRLALLAVFPALVPVLSWAQGINTNVALPVYQGEGIWRSQARTRIATEDPSDLGREERSTAMPQTFVYGVSPRLTAFATVPFLARKRTEELGTSDRTAPALGDVTLLGRYVLYADDYAPLSTKRVAALFGVKLPTGADRAGKPSWDPIVGGVATWAQNRHELDLDFLFHTSVKRHGFSAGDQIRYDAAYRYRLWPGRFGKRLLQLNALVELNGSWKGRNHDHGHTVRDSGGHVLFLSPGVQLASLRWILEASLQIPIAQDLNGPQLETDFVAVLSVRIPFILE